jgi:transcriptional/translational regulatory protein YebC/TACO1
MSGHSKWHTIKHKKGALDAKRGKTFTKLIKEITVAARFGGGDAGANARLRKAVSDAKAASGSVGYLFDKKGYIVVEKSSKPEDELFEVVTDAGAEDLRDDEDNFEIITAPESFDAVLDAVKNAGVEPQLAEIEMIPQNYIKLAGAEAKQMLKLMESLEDHDDVQKVSANFDIDEADMT